MRALDDMDRDLVARTVIGEAASEGDDGMAGVAAVIRNRLASGRFGSTPADVILAPRQFEPWSSREGRSRMMAPRRDAPEYQRAMLAVDRVFGDESYDPTNGATHFFAPEAQAALGRQPPSWAKGEGQPIGRHTFYAPEGRVQTARPSFQIPEGFEPMYPPGSSDVPANQEAAPPFAIPAGFEPIEAAPAARSQGATFDERFNAVSDEAAFRAVGQEPKPPKTTMEKLGETWPGKMVKSIASAVTLPGDVLAGKTHVPSSDGSLPGSVPFGDQESAGERIADLAGFGAGSVAAGTGKALAAGAGLAKATKAASTAASPSIAELKAAASAGYRSPEVESLAIKPSAMSDFSASAQAALNEAGIDANLAPKTFGVLTRFEKFPEQSVVTGKNLNSIRRTFSNAAQSTDATERLAAKTVIDHLDDFLPKVAADDVVSGDVAAAAKTLETARGNYAAAKRSELVDEKSIRAELRAAAANSGQNVANTVRQRMADILLKPKSQRGFSADELAFMEQIVRGTPSGNALRTAGNVLGGGGGLGSVAAGFAGSVAAGPVGAMAPLAGYAMKALSNRMTLKQADELSALVRSRAPLAKAMQDYEESVSLSFQGEGNATSLAEISRRLAQNLKQVGITASAKELVDYAKRSNQSE